MRKGNGYFREDQQDTSPQMPSAIREREREREDLADTIPPDSRYRVPATERELGVQVVKFMNRSDQRLAEGDQRMGKIETALGALTTEVRLHILTKDRFMMACTAISTAVWLLFLLMKLFGPLDLSEWRGGRAQAQQQQEQ